MITPAGGAQIGVNGFRSVPEGFEIPVDRLKQRFVGIDNSSPDFQDLSDIGFTSR
jgi:hypothetical protein